MKACWPICWPLDWHNKTKLLESIALIYRQHFLSQHTLTEQLLTKSRIIHARRADLNHGCELVLEHALFFLTCYAARKGDFLCISKNYTILMPLAKCFGLICVKKLYASSWSYERWAQAGGRAQGSGRASADRQAKGQKLRDTLYCLIAIMSLPLEFAAITYINSGLKCDGKSLIYLDTIVDELSID